MSEDPLARAMRRGERFGSIPRAFVSGERFEELTVERRKVGRLVVTSNRLVVCDPFSLGFGFSALERKVPRGQFPVELSVAHVRKGKRKGQQVVAAVRVRFGEGEATGFRLAEVPDTKPTRLLGARFSGYAVESGVGCVVDADQAQAVADACAEAFAQGELDPEPNRDLRDELARPPADQRGWGSANLDGVHGSLLAFNTGWGDGVYPSYWGYDEERRLVSLVSDFLVLPTDHELVRESWRGRSWREFVYEGDRGDRFWRIRIQGSKRTIQHGAVGRPGQTYEKDLQTSDKAFRSAARKILKQTEQGYVELTSDASRIRHRKSRRERKLAQSEAPAGKPARRRGGRAGRARVEVGEDAARPAERARADASAVNGSKPSKGSSKPSKGSSKKNTGSGKQGKPSKGSGKQGKPSKGSSKQGKPSKPSKGSGKPSKKNTGSGKQGKPSKPSKGSSKPSKPSKPNKPGKASKGSSKQGKQRQSKGSSQRSKGSSTRRKAASQRSAGAGPSKRGEKGASKRGRATPKRVGGGRRERRRREP